MVSDLIKKERKNGIIASRQARTHEKKRHEEWEMTVWEETRRRGKKYTLE